MIYIYWSSCTCQGICVSVHQILRFIQPCHTAQPGRSHHRLQKEYNLSIPACQVDNKPRFTLMRGWKPRIHVRFPHCIQIALPLRSVADMSAILMTPKLRLQTNCVWLQRIAWYKSIMRFGCSAGPKLVHTSHWCDLSPFKMTGLKSHLTVARELKRNAVWFLCDS